MYEQRESQRPGSRADEVIEWGHCGIELAAPAQMLWEQAAGVARTR